MAEKKKRKITERAFVAISPAAHAVIKNHADKEGYTLGKFVEIAALEKIEFQKSKK
jgi:hypothetical protein